MLQPAQPRKQDSLRQGKIQALARRKLLLNLATENFHSTSNTSLHRSDRSLDFPGDLRLRQSRKVGKFDHLTLVRTFSEDAGQSFENPREASSESDAPAHRFSPAELAAIAELTNDVKCECPQHLANLVTSLNAFELYSKECGNRNADDARLHQFLYLASAEARRTMENALAKILEFEDLKIPG